MLKEHLIWARAGSIWGQWNLFFFFPNLISNQIERGHGNIHTLQQARQTQMSMHQMDLFALIGGTLNPRDS